MPTDYESEETLTREQAEATLRELADGIAAGRLQVGEHEDAMTIAIPDDLAVEFELETEDDTRSVEIEIEWPYSGDDPGDDAEATADTPQTESTAPVDVADAQSEQPDAVSEVASTPLPIESGGPLESLGQFELFQDRGDEWRWRLRHRNGNVIASSGEGYTRKHNARKGLRSVMRNAPAADVVDVE